MVVTVDAVVYYQAIDPVKLEYNVQNFVLAATKLAQTNLLALMREVKADVVLDSRKIIGAQLREVLDEATDVWGTKVVRVELGQIEFGQAATHVSRSEGDVAREGSGIVTMARD